MSDGIQVRNRPRKGAHPAEQGQHHEDHHPIDSGETAQSEGDESTEATEIAVEDAKLQLLLGLHLRNWSQRRMADYFDVTERTIRNWLTKLKSRKLIISKDLDPLGEVIRSLCRFAAMEADLLDWKCEAETAKDFKAMLAFSKELRQLEKARFEFLNRLDLFDQVQLLSGAGEDGSVRQADLVFNLTREIFQFADDTPEAENRPEGE